MFQTADHINSVNEIKESFNTIEKFSKLDLIKSSELGSNFSFQSGATVFKSIFDLLNSVKGFDFMIVPYDIIRKFQERLTETINLLNQINGFDPSVSNPIQQRDSLINQLRNRHDELYSLIIPILTLSLYKNSDNENNKSEIEKLKSDLNKEIEATKNSSQSFLEEIKSTLESAKKATLDVGLLSNAKIFLEESKEHEKHASKWLLRSTVILCIIGVFGVGFLLLIMYNNYESSKIIHMTIAKIVILTVLFYALNICNKNYKAHKHNELTNKHRHNSLNTFEAFVKSTNDEQTKNAVLLEATRTIFSNQQSGYIVTENEAEFPTKIIEVIKGSQAGGA